MTTRPFHVRLAEVLRWARANDWRPLYQRRRRIGQYSWTNAVPDPGTREQSTLRVNVDVDGYVEVRQRMTDGWLTIAWFRTGSGSGIIDILAGMSVLPERMSTIHRHLIRSLRLRRAGTVSDGSMPCPVPHPDGRADMPCTKTITAGWTADEGHPGGHRWIGAAGEASLPRGHYDNLDMVERIVPDQAAR